MITFFCDTCGYEWDAWKETACPECESKNVRPYQSEVDDAELMDEEYDG